MAAATASSGAGGESDPVGLWGCTLATVWLFCCCGGGAAAAAGGGVAAAVVAGGVDFLVAAAVFAGFLLVFFGTGLISSFGSSFADGEGSTSSISFISGGRAVPTVGA